MKNLKKRMTFVLCAALCCLCLGGCGSRSSSTALKDIEDNVRNITDATDKHVLAVKNGAPVLIPQITYGQAFEEFFSNPTWKYFEGEGGEDVVEFTGGCTYLDEEVKARLQFILSKDDDTFEQGALSFNDVPQTNLITAAMIYKAFSDYAENHNITIDDEDSAENEFIPETGGTDDTQTDSSQDSSSLYDNSSDTTDDSSDIDDDYDSYDDYDDSDDEYDDYDTEDTDLDEYVFPDSDTRKLTKSDVKGLSKDELRIGRNEIYARHGRRFTDQQLQEYFDGTDWYVGTIDPDDFDETQYLSKLERRNANFIKKFE